MVREVPLVSIPYTSLVGSYYGCTRGHVYVVRELQISKHNLVDKQKLRVPL